MEVAKLLLGGTKHLSEDLTEKTIEQTTEVRNSCQTGNYIIPLKLYHN